MIDELFGYFEIGEGSMDFFWNEFMRNPTDVPHNLNKIPTITSNFEK
jgi:hypothetical protein